MSLDDFVAHQAASSVLDVMVTDSSGRTRWGCVLILVLLLAAIILYFYWPPKEKSTAMHQQTREHRILTIQRNGAEVYPNRLSEMMTSRMASAPKGFYAYNIGFTVTVGDRLLIVTNQQQVDHVVDGFWFDTLKITLTDVAVIVSNE